MKKLFFLFTALGVVTVIATSFIPKEQSPKLYPELEAYFKSVEAGQIIQDHLSSLENIKAEINVSDIGLENWNLIFYCSENSFRSQASQVFAQTLCYAKKHRNINVFSAGLTTGEIDARLIAHLSRIGYRITKSEKDGKTVYMVRYSDQDKPITLYSKTASDKSLPKTSAVSVVVCDVVKEKDCAEIKTESTPVNLAFPKVLSGDGEDKVEQTLKNIASEMIYITNKKS